MREERSKGAQTFDEIAMKVAERLKVPISEDQSHISTQPSTIGQ